MISKFKKITANPLFSAAMDKIEKAETTRIYCCHGIEHLLSVARIAYITVLENKLDISMDIIYAAALLHDIGRAEEYENGTPHNHASAEISKAILEDCGYSENEINLITKAIINHGHDENHSVFTLDDIIQRADRLSRNCFRCNAYDSCNWNNEKKNNIIIY